jgi:hypothetical protein
VLRLGETVQVGYVDQSRDALNADKTVWEEITGGLDEVEMGKRSVAGPCLLLVVQLQGRQPAAQGSERCRAANATACTWPSCCRRLQPAAARRADQRPRRRHAARARGRLLELCRLRRGHQPRPVVPGPHRDAHAGLRGRQPGGVVRGKLPGLRADRKRRLGPRRIARIGSSTGS